MKRIVALQTKLQTMATARLAAAETRKNEIVEAREALQSFVEANALTGPLAIRAIETARRLAARETEAERRRLVMAEARQKAEARLKLAERAEAALARDERTAAERKALERLIEEAVAQADMAKPDAGERR